MTDIFPFRDFRGDDQDGGALDGVPGSSAIGGRTRKIRPNNLNDDYIYDDKMMRNHGSSKPAPATSSGTPGVGGNHIAKDHSNATAGSGSSAQASSATAGGQKHKKIPPSSSGQGSSVPG